MTEKKQRTSVAYNLFNTPKGKRFYYNYLGETIVRLFEVASADYSKGKEYNVKWKRVGRQLLVLASLVKRFWEDKDGLNRSLTLKEVAGGLMQPEKVLPILEELARRGFIMMNDEDGRTRNFTYKLLFDPVKPKEKIDLSNEDKDLNDEKYIINHTKTTAASEELEHEFEAPVNDAVNAGGTETDEYEKKLSMCVGMALEGFEWVASIIKENKALRDAKKTLEAKNKELEEKNTELKTKLDSKNVEETEVVEAKNETTDESEGSILGWLSKSVRMFKKADTITRGGVATGDYTTSIESLRSFETARSL